MIGLVRHELTSRNVARDPNVYAFPSSVDNAHFARARGAQLSDPLDQRHLPGPRLGYFGVIDERLDLDLLAKIADADSTWQVVMVGPVVKINPDDLPRRPNIHYLGQKTYDELPAYLAGWDVALMPFALNEATRFISPTKTLEYLAAGKPIVSTAIRDVVTPYGEKSLVRIADHETFALQIEDALLTSVWPRSPCTPRSAGLSRSGRAKTHAPRGARRGASGRSCERARSRKNMGFSPSR